MTIKQLQALGDFISENQDIFTKNMNFQTAALYAESLEWILAALDFANIGCEVYIKIVQE